jgi:hypothetical protein
LKNLLKDINEDITLLKEGCVYDISMIRIIDDFSNTQAGYGFNVENNFIVRSSILVHIINNSHLQEKYFCYQRNDNNNNDNNITGDNNNDCPILNVDSVSRWLYKYDELIEKILLLIHIGSGMPAR